MLSLQVGPATALEGASDRYTDRYETWLNTAAHPQVVAAVLLVDADAGHLRLRRWNPESHAFEAGRVACRARANGARDSNEELSDFTAGRPPTRRASFRGDDSVHRHAAAQSRRARSRPAPVPQTVTPVFGFTIMQLNMAYIREQMLPELAQRHFIHAEGDVYRVSVTSADDPSKVLYRSDPGAPVEREHADATAGLLGRMDPIVLLQSPAAAWRPRSRSAARRRRFDDGPDGFGLARRRAVRTMAAAGAASERIARSGGDRRATIATWASASACCCC